jgi:hypothetical protein
MLTKVKVISGEAAYVEKEANGDLCDSAKAAMLLAERVYNEARAP